MLDQTHQRTRAQSNILLLAFMAAAILLIAAEFFMIFYVFGSKPEADTSEQVYSFARISGIVALFVGLAALFRAITLSTGGAAIAKMLGATPIVRGSSVENDRLYGLLDDVAAKAGVSSPSLYIMENESGINAFVAGTSAADTALALTRGAVVRLNDSELRGVLAHECAHIVNGDMRLNTRLISVQFGILALGFLGAALIFSGSLLAQSSRDDDDGADKIGLLSLLARSSRSLDSLAS